MKYAFQCAGEVITVDLEATAGAAGAAYTVSSGGTMQSVEVIGPPGVMKSVVVGGHPLPVSVARDGGRLLVQVGVDVYELEVARPGRTGKTAAVRRDPLVKSPIAGKVMRYFVAVGDHVAAGQKLVSVEAMKMENEIHGTAPGKVLRVGPEAGQAVQPGALLIELELDPEG